MQTKERQLLSEIANEAHVSGWKDLRWFAVGGNKPRSIVVCTRGKAKTVKTISAKSNPEAWESWKPVLTDWLERRGANGKRVNHKELQTGSL